MKRMVLLILLVLSLASCAKSYSTKDIDGVVWMKENLQEEKFSDGTDIDYYKYESKSDTNNYGYLYSYNSIKDNKIILDGYRIPTLDEFTGMVNSFENIDAFIDQMNVVPAGMYDFTEVEQWVGESALFLTIDDDTPKVVFFHFSDKTMQVGDFHPDDYVSIRLIKDNK